MSKVNIRSIITALIAVTIAYLIAQANEAHTVEWNGYSVYLLAAILAFAINWIAFIPAFLAQTERFYDLTGSITYLSLLALCVYAGNVMDNPRALLIVGLAGVWTIRLGTFLFRRISKDGGRDGRFDQIKVVPLRFFAAWTLQALWVFLTLCAGLAVLTSTKVVPIDSYAIAGVIIWIIGFAIEVVADAQKSAFKADASNKGQFITTGLWAYSRHPNYFGEIVLWIGIFVIAIPVLQGWQWATLISPIFVYMLLNYVSGVNLLEQRADKKWGGQEDYEQYKKQTSVLVPMPIKK